MARGLTLTPRRPLCAGLALVAGWSLVACSADDLELLPFSADAGGEDAAADAGEIDSGEADSGPPDTGMPDPGGFGLCLNELVDCSSCPQAPCGAGCPGRCAAACDINANCAIRVSDGAVPDSEACLDGTECGLPGEALMYCRALSETCIINAGAGDLTCLEGECRFECSGPVRGGLPKRQLPAELSGGWMHVFDRRRVRNRQCSPARPRTPSPALPPVPASR